MSDPITGSTGWGERTATDLTSLLVDLSRLLKALTFYAPGHPSRESLAERAFLAWQAELRRAGPVEFVVRDDQLWSDQVSEGLEPDSMHELVDALEVHGIRKLSFAADIARETFSTFAELLSDREADPQFGFATRFYPQSTSGIEVNDEPRTSEPMLQMSAGPSASLGSALLGGVGAAVAPVPSVPTSAGLHAPAASETPTLDGGHASTVAPSAHRAAAGQGFESTDPPQASPSPTPANAEPGVPMPTVLEDPFEAQSQSMPGELLRLNLRELDRCTDDALYEVLVGRVSASASELVDAEQVEEGLRAALVLADHAAGQSGSSGAQARMAQAALESLVGARLLDELMTRACARATHGIRPAQVLLQLGDKTMNPLLNRLEEETDRDSVAHLSAVVIALGEHAIPALGRTISRESGKRTQLAIRLAGELQSPKLVPTLYSVLRDSGPALRREAARALVNIGNSEACDVLIKSLASKSDDLPRLAALSLGILKDERAVQPLIRALDHACQQRRPHLAAELIRALGQFEHQRDMLVPKLGAILEQRGVMRRRKQRSPKLAALSVLARCPGTQARRILVSATRDPDPKISEEARSILAGPDRG